MRMGILGAGNIAHTMAYTVSNMEGIELYCVASRDLEKASIFKDQYRCTKIYGSYEEMYKDPKVDVIYIATPHSMHFKHAMQCLKNGKHVLCEKAFALNYKEAKEMIDFATEKNLFIGEAFWTRFMPLRALVQEQIDKGTIGDITSITANLCSNLVSKDRIMKPELGGGALLDLGVYPINFALMFAGSGIKHVETSASFTSTHVDSRNNVNIIFANGVKANLFSSILMGNDGQGIIYGTKGYIVCEHVNNLHIAKIYDLDGKEKKVIDCSKQITGYEFEVESMIKAIESKQLECKEMSHNETLRVMKLLDELRSRWGFKYPNE